MSAQTTDRRQCIRVGCLERAETVAQIRRTLGAALPPDGDPAAAVRTIVARSAQLLRQRNAYAAALRRVQELWKQSQHKAGIVLADELGAALYIGEDEIR